MKGVNTLMLLLVFMTYQAFAQSDLGFGIKTGMNISTQKTNEEVKKVSISSLVGFHIRGFDFFNPDKSGI